jgi:hypothetical protein
MTTHRDLNSMLDAFLAEGSNELADRVIDGALDQIDHIHQRRAMRLPRRLQTMPMLTRLAAAAVIGVVAVGAALYLIKPGPSGVGTSSQTPVESASPGAPARTAAPTATPRPIPTGPLGEGRQIQTATLLADGRVLVAGGYGGPGGGFEDVLDSADLYDPSTNTFSATGPLISARGLHTATLLADGRVLIAGGGPASWTSSVGAYLSSVELYDPTTGLFSDAGSMTTPREDHTATLLPDGRVLIVGGNDVGSHAVTSAELYDPTTGVFTATGSMMTARGFHTATLLSDGRVLVAGGDPAAWSDNAFLASAEIYDPKTEAFTPTGSMAVGRFYPTATLLTDGRVLIIGGTSSGGSSLTTAELYDPTTGSFSQTGRMAEGRVYQTATLLPDGRVLVAGGCVRGRDYASCVFRASAELYDPTTGTFAATGPMSSSRVYHTATLLPDGQVLVAAGVGEVADSAPLASAELYDPVTGTFGPAG